MTANLERTPSAASFDLTLAALLAETLAVLREEQDPEERFGQRTRAAATSFVVVPVPQSVAFGVGVLPNRRGGCRFRAEWDLSGPEPRLVAWAFFKLFRTEVRTLREGTTWPTTTT